MADIGDMSPDLVIVIAGIASAWVVFSIIGGERQRFLQKMDADKAAADAAAAEAANPPLKKLSTAPAAKKPAG
jgi:hypothetical protein